MNRQEYLNQISKSSAPVKGAKPGILQSKFFMVGAVGVILFILIAIVGAILGGGGDDQSRSIALELHLTGTMEVMSDYQPKVKSSDLRSNSSSLYGVLSGAETNLSNFLAEKYDYNGRDVDKNLQLEADTEQDALDSALFEAKINGNLDRIYAHKLTYEVSKFMSEADKIARTTDNENLRAIMKNLSGNLAPLYDKFSEFSQGQ